MSDDGLVPFAFRPWRSDRESWEAFLAEVERAYAQYLDRYHQRRGTDPEAPESNVTAPGSMAIQPNIGDCSHQ